MLSAVRSGINSSPLPPEMSVRSESVMLQPSDKNPLGWDRLDELSLTCLADLGIRSHVELVSRFSFASDLVVNEWLKEAGLALHARIHVAYLLKQLPPSPSARHRRARLWRGARTHVLCRGT